jgi:hypothetical protein
MLALWVTAGSIAPVLALAHALVVVPWWRDLQAMMRMRVLDATKSYFHAYGATNVGVTRQPPEPPEPEQPQKRGKRRKGVPRMLTAEAEQLPELPKIEGDEMTFVHTVRAGLAERRDLALILADSAERCCLLPRFAKLFAVWADQLFAAYDNEVTDVVLVGKGFGWGEMYDRQELDRLLRIAVDWQSQPSPSLTKLHRAAAIKAYGTDGQPVPIQRDPYRQRDDEPATSTLQRMMR